MGTQLYWLHQISSRSLTKLPIGSLSGLRSEERWFCSLKHQIVLLLLLFFQGKLKDESLFMLCRWEELATCSFCIWVSPLKAFPVDFNSCVCHKSLLCAQLSVALPPNSSIDLLWFRVFSSELCSPKMQTKGALDPSQDPFSIWFCVLHCTDASAAEGMELPMGPKGSIQLLFPRALFASSVSPRSSLYHTSGAEPAAQCPIKMTLQLSAVARRLNQFWGSSP